MELICPEGLVTSHCLKLTFQLPLTPFSDTTINENSVLHQLLHLTCLPKLDILNFDSKLLRLAAPLISPLL